MIHQSQLTTRSYECDSYGYINNDRDTELVAEAEVTWACSNDQGKLIRIPPELDIPELEP